MLDANFIVFDLFYIYLFYVVRFVVMGNCKCLFVVSILVENMKIFGKDTLVDFSGIHILNWDFFKAMCVLLKQD